MHKIFNLLYTVLVYRFGLELIQQYKVHVHLRMSVYRHKHRAMPSLEAF